MEPFYPTSRKKCPEVTPLCENFLSDRILAMPIPKNRLHWTIFLVILVSLPLLVILLTRKNVTLVINGQTQKVVTYSLTTRGLLRSGAIALSEADAISPPLNAWLGRGDTITIDKAAQVQIHVDEEVFSLFTPQRIPIVILAEAGVNLNPADEIIADGLLVAIDKPLASAQKYSLLIRRATSIELFDGGQSHSFTSTASTLGGALWEQGITLYQRDQLEPSFDTPLQGGVIQVQLERSRELSIQLQGKTIQTRSVKTRVGEVLSESGVALQGSDYSLPPESDAVPEDGKIQVIRLREEVLLEQEPLPFGVSQQGVADLAIDSTQLVQAGEYGLNAQRVRVIYEARPGTEGWVEVSRNVEDEWVARQPQDRIIGYGTKIEFKTASTADGPIEYWRAVEAFATSYSPCRLGIDDYCNSTTASGQQLQKGMIGVVRGWYNYMVGQRVYIPGYGFATIEDIGAGVSGRHWVDLGYSDEEWVQWSQTVTVYFLAPVPANVLWILE
jgi:resuscitation-promoting factor RpfB